MKIHSILGVLLFTACLSATPSWALQAQPTSELLIPPPNHTVPVPHGPDYTVIECPTGPLQQLITTASITTPAGWTHEPMGVEAQAVYRANYIFSGQLTCTYSAPQYLTIETRLAQTVPSELNCGVMGANKEVNFSNPSVAVYDGKFYCLKK